MSARDTVKAAIARTGLLGTARALRRDALTLSARARARGSRARTRSARVQLVTQHPELRVVELVSVTGGRTTRREVLARTRATPSAAVALESNRTLVTQALEAAGIPYLDLPIDSVNRFRVGVRDVDADAVLEALVEQAGPGAYVYFDGGAVLGPERVQHLATTPLATLRRLRDRALLYRVFQYHASPDGRDVLGDIHGCEVEAWLFVPEEDTFVATRANRLAASLAEPLFTRERIPPDLRRATAPRLSTDSDFPIDIVYTWVDGNDPAWRQRKDATLGTHSADELHPEAMSDARYASRDELRYSLRSIEKYADFVRHVYLVTDDQRPEWLRTDHPRLTVIDHHDIFDDHDALPTFNSHSIEARLHHVPGLSEHYLYMNDDFLFMRRVRPSLFFAPNGLARFFESRALMPLGGVSTEVKPVDAAAMNGRRLVQERFGGMPTRKFKHAPYPQRRSVHLAIEELFPDDVQRTVHSRVRSTTDLALASSLHHHVGFALGLAVPGRIDSAYVDLGLPTLEMDLAGLRQRRSFDTLCLNDTDSEEMTTELKNRLVAEFLDAYFPEASSFERDGPDPAAVA